MTRGDYRRLCAAIGADPDDALLPPERPAALPGWLCNELIATEAAAEKLRGWGVRTPPPWTAPTAAEVLTRIHFAGADVPLAHLVARLLAERLPPPVTDYAIEHVTFIGAGRSIGGFCGPRIDFGTRPWVIVLANMSVANDDWTPDLIAHELTHSWLLGEPHEDVRCAGAFWYDRRGRSRSPGAAFWPPIRRTHGRSSRPCCCGL